jgi:hypothetical protein
MSKIAFASTTVMLLTVVLPIEVPVARANDLKVAFNRNANDRPNGGVCPNGRMVKNPKACKKFGYTTR